MSELRQIDPERMARLFQAAEAAAARREQREQSRRDYANSESEFGRCAPAPQLASQAPARSVRPLGSLIPATTTTTTTCPRCLGLGWLIARGNGGELVRCGCQPPLRTSGGEELDTDKTFATFIPRLGLEEALLAAHTVADAEKSWLYLYSAEKGTGKTHLLHAVGNGLASAGKSVYLTNSRGLIRAVYQRRDDAAQLERFLMRLKEVDALLIDELRYRITDWAWEHLHEVFDYRYQHRFTTCFASNYSPSALEGNALRLAATDPYQSDQLDTLTSRLRDRRIALVAEHRASDYRPIAE